MLTSSVHTNINSEHDTQKTTYLDGFVRRSTKQVILMDTQTPDWAAVSNERSFTLEDLLRVEHCEYNAHTMTVSK